MDTGARSSSLHAFDVRVITAPDGDRVRFNIHPRQRDGRNIVAAEAAILDRRTIRSSSGHASTRYVIETRLEIAGESWPIELTLTNRDEMGFRMLLGRQAIRRRFVVDPGLSYLTGRVNPLKGPATRAADAPRPRGKSR